jgi:hypothetical protein
MVQVVKLKVQRWVRMPPLTCSTSAELSLRPYWRLRTLLFSVLFGIGNSPFAIEKAICRLYYFFSLVLVCNRGRSDGALGVEYCAQAGAKSSATSSYSARLSIYGVPLFCNYKPLLFKEERIKISWAILFNFYSRKSYS